MRYKLDEARKVSTRAPHAGSDNADITSTVADIGFNPRPPCGERRHSQMQPKSDICFNPRPPCGERPLLQGVVAMAQAFQPAPPMRGATSEEATK